MRPRVALLDHGMGNMRSVAKALEAAGAEVVQATSSGQIKGTDALCVPGQGIFGRCMAGIVSLGLVDGIRGWVADDKPFLGICLGMQILFAASEEGEGSEGLGVFSGRVVKLPAGVRVPHIGWNTVNDRYMYFDHSYAAVPDDPSIVTGWCDHGLKFAAQIERGPLMGVQFHPEKSSRDGIALLTRWVGGL